MRRTSIRRQHRNREAAPVRADLIERVARCEFCGRQLVPLCVHEILRGSYRAKAQDKLFAVLVLCWQIEGNCHDLMSGKGWDEQLAILRRSRPDDYDLAAFHVLASRVKPDREQVDLWLKRFAFLTP
jgi:hypothetical protein